MEPTPAKKPLIPRELKRFFAAMLGIIVSMAIVSVVVALLVEQ
ncbi:MAG TPA: hypothetical protein VM553_11540 [Dongiaceae bacterium]|nr:hypothetical protein [Dongiaceae bacterium]